MAPDEQSRDHTQAALLVAGVDAYGRMIGSDEAGAAERLQVDHAEIIDPCFQRHGGTVVRTAGEGTLVAFGNIVEAVQCGIDLQRGMRERNDARPEQERIVFRVGIDAGRLTGEGDDPADTDLDVATRLESLCPPGGVLLSGDVAKVVDGRIDTPLAYRGERHDEASGVRLPVWQVMLDGAEGSVVTPLRHPRRWTGMLLAIGALSVAALLALMLVFEAPG